MNVALVSRRHTSYDVWFWLWWVVATMLGWAGGEWYGFFLSLLAPSNATIVLSVSAVVGLLQWLVFRAEAAEEASRLAWWAPAGVAGLALPLGLSALIWGQLSNAGWLMAAVAGGALAGLLQQSTLRPGLRLRWWWVLASATGWGLGMLAYAVSSALAPDDPAAIEAWSPFALLMDFVPGLLVGTLTGTVLVWLRRQPALAPAPAAPPVPPWDLNWRRRLIAGLMLAAVPLLLFRLPGPLFMSWETARVPPEYQELMRSMASDQVRGVAFSPDGSRLLTSAPDQGAVLIDLATGGVLLTFPGAFNPQEGAMADVAFSPDGVLLVTADVVYGGKPAPDRPLPAPHDATLRLWDASSGANVRAFPGLEQGISSVAFSPDGAWLAAASAGPTRAVHLLDVATGTVVRTLTRDLPVADLAFSPNSSLIAVADGVTVTLWDVTTGDVRGSIAVPGVGMVLPGPRIAFSPDNGTLAVALGDGSVQLWDLMNGALRLTLEAHGAQVGALAFSPDGQLLATASEDKTVKLWDVTAGTAVRTLEGHAWSVRGVAFSPDGSRLASASFDGTVKLWDVATGAELRSIMMAQSVKTPNRATIRAGCSFPHCKTLHKSERRMRAMPEPVQAGRPHHARSRPGGGHYR